MLRTVLFCIAVFAQPLCARADCAGVNQIDALTPQVRADLRARADALPHSRGNFWRATRGDAVLTLIGTYHLDDPRHDAAMALIGPLVDAASAVLVEAGPKEEADLQAALARDPSLIFLTDGPTLPETLPPAVWDRLKAALWARSIPPFLGAKMQPAYLSMILGIPPCAAKTALSGGANGLDQRIVARATAAGVPVRALEPYDTVFDIFAQMTPEDQRQMLEMSLAAEAQSEDVFATMLQSYFAQDSRMIWELSRWQMLQIPGVDPARTEADIAMMEDNLMSRRNRTWIPVIEDALKSGPALAAFGALHLSGQDGVLALLERAGFTVERLPL